VIEELQKEERSAGLFEENFPGITSVENSLQG
jgi:hypothetical protein